MRKGFTTGSCSAAAAGAAARAVITGEFPEEAVILLPRGEKLALPVLQQKKEIDRAVCAVKKDSGDDPDVTDGALVFAQVRLLSRKAFEAERVLPGAVVLQEKILLKGGEGIGVVTKPGLACAVGEPAINPVPREMIRRAVGAEMENADDDRFAEVTVSIPEGVSLAEKTFNPKLGIQGGISVLGTTGIVEPMSEQALIDTIRVEMKVCRAAGNRTVVITPGNYGKRFLQDSTDITEEMTVKCSNFIGEALDFAVEERFEAVVLSGHLGKLIKVAGGVMNTHSKYGDGRMTFMAGIAKVCGAGRTLTENILRCVMVDEAVRLLDEAGLAKAAMEETARRVSLHLERRTGTQNCGVILFSNKYGLLAQTENVPRLLRKNEEK